MNEDRARPPTAEEQELFEWADQVVRDEVRNLQEALKQVVTLATAMVAASAVILGPVQAEWWAKAGVGMLFLAALLVALYGWMPYERAFDKNVVEEVQSERDRLRRLKSLCLRFSVLVIAAAMVVMLTTVILAGGR